MRGIPTDQVLAIVRLKQWAVDRAALKSARTSHAERQGWQQRRNRNADARLVRVLDFERAFARLSLDEQAVLALVYREGQGRDTAAAALGCSVRKVAYLIPAARQHLANILDRLDML